MRKPATVELWAKAVYDPTADAEEVEYSFYDEIQDAIVRTPSGDYLFVA